MANHNRATFEEETISVLGMQAVTSGRWVAVAHSGYLHPCRYVTSMQSKPWMTPLKLKAKEMTRTKWLEQMSRGSAIASRSLDLARCAGYPGGGIARLLLRSIWQFS